MIGSSLQRRHMWKKLGHLSPHTYTYVKNVVSLYFSKLPHRQIHTSPTSYLLRLNVVNFKFYFVYRSSFLFFMSCRFVSPLDSHHHHHYTYTHYTPPYKYISYTNSSCMHKRGKKVENPHFTQRLSIFFSFQGNSKSKHA